MFRQLIFLPFFMILTLSNVWSQGYQAQTDYVNKWKDEAVRQMEIYKIPASITLAQGVLESGNGVSELAKKSNNHFGIKCHQDWTGGRAYHDDDEKGECFRVYDDPRDSYEDHSKFLLRSRYSSLFELDLEDYKGWAKGLSKCGYATNPKYPELLITIIERHELYKLDAGDWVDEKEAVADAHRGGKLHTSRTLHSVSTTENGIQFVYADQGDSIEKLAEQFDMMKWQFRKYNEVDKNHVFRKGEIVYLQPKKNSGFKDWHTVRGGETIWSISQKYGIKMKALAKKNNIPVDSHLRIGMKLSLKWRLNENGELPGYAKLLGGK
ncbi:MAG: N-acetylmuramoyl-L-alanine amidase [Euryarchaeota archaeon]|nr:N-acetylmuramoyl-L-alanine amidase [Euryarchaeota archaeon]|tara:strand:+ start:3008 stop:3976 length:969 start_codon:yes stop_codon:yes gene_type:complete